ncbi:sulfite exporter TauE/SafE family protein [Pseudoalteromonas sp. Z9A5]|uniref:sulfite exporter TauE/SafE family protein n=1 Tax=Pseudoalteromonas sp. Z9A5 TaxID=2686355 RepID=UPI001407D525|nr:sulfite exporter TauE/SafE family protein [Pseudoalteromonas sp. Z9A5]
MDLFTSDLISPLFALLLIILSGVTSFISAAFGAGGGLMLLVVMASVMPMSVVVPVHGLVQLGSNTNRLLLSFKHIDKSMFVYFTFGGIAGALLSSLVMTDIKLDVMKLIVGVFVIYLLWGKKPVIKTDSIIWRFGAGLVTTFICMFAGASGPLVGSCLYVSDYSKLKYTATFSSIMSVQHLLKAIIYGAVGFSFWQWLPLISAMVLSGAVGTWLGIKLLHSMPADKFKRVFKFILTLLALQLAWQGIGVVLS